MVLSQWSPSRGFSHLVSLRFDEGGDFAAENPSAVCGHHFLIRIHPPTGSCHACHSLTLEFATHQAEALSNMFSSKLFALCAFATVAISVHADEYQDDGSSYYEDEGSSYEDEGSSYYEDDSGSYYEDDSSSYYEDDSGSSFDYSALPAYTYTFDPEYSAGVSGTINVQYAGPFSTFAVITAALDFSDVDQSEIMAFDGNCTEEVTAYKWHIHVKWPNDGDSESFEQCALSVVGNHYDPLLACGPNSEFVGTDECLLKTPLYKCNPDDYAENPLVCEKGDLSGKFGDFQLDADKKVSEQYFDLNYPLPEENTPEWNMMVHAVCGKATPRIACAVGKLVDSDWSSTSYYH